MGAGFGDAQAPLRSRVIKGEFSRSVQIEAVRLAAKKDDGLGLDLEVHLVGLVDVGGVLEPVYAGGVDVLDWKVGVERLLEFERARTCVVNVPDNFQCAAEAELEFEAESVGPDCESLGI